MKIVVGKNYEVKHPDGGTFVLQVQSISNGPIQGLILQSQADFLTKLKLGPGDQIVVDQTLYEFKLTDWSKGGKRE